MHRSRFVSLALLLAAAAGCSRSSEPEPAVPTPTVAASAQQPAAKPAEQPAEQKILIAFIEAEPEVGPAPLRVKFSVYDPYQRLERPTYRWNFGDGSPESSERFPEHVYAKPGDYEVTLVVEEDGATDEDSVEIQVEAPDAD